MNVFSQVDLHNYQEIHLMEAGYSMNYPPELASNPRDDFNSNILQVNKNFKFLNLKFWTVYDIFEPSFSSQLD